MTPPHIDPGTEFDRQVHTLIDKGYPALSGRTPEAFADLLEPLRKTVTADPPASGPVPFVLVVTRDVAPIERTVPLLTLDGRTRTGVIDRNFPDPDRFVPAAGVTLPDPRVYVLFEVDRGEEFCGAVPDHAMATIAERGRTPLTIEDGVALVTQHPAVLAKNKCFSLGGSRCGDRRVPALWISQNAPKLGWCWAGNPHTWLGVASATRRAA